MTFREFLKDNIVLLDGGMGTLLQERGIAPGERSERWSVTHPEVVREMKRIFMNDLEHSRRVVASEWKKRPLWNRFWESLVRLLSPLL